MTRATFRPGRMEDIPDLLALENCCFRGVYAAHRFERRDFAYYLGHASARVCVAAVRGSPRAYLIGLWGNRSRRHTARILSLATDPRHRRAGLGDRLCRRFISASTRAGRRRISAEVYARNGRALQLFENLGFERTRRLADYYGPGADGLRLRLDTEK